jgi:hypothetical protein
MRLDLRLCALALLLAIGAGAAAQTTIRTETIRPPAASPDQSAPAPQREARAEKDRPSGHLAPSAALPEIITDPAHLPAPVARTRERILAAARSGELQQLAALMSETAPTFSFSDHKDPIALWKATYPDSDGTEALSILITILETGFVRLDAGTEREIFVWPYFVRMPLDALSPPQKVELFRIMTGADYKDMLAFGAYAFYRLGITADGTWQFFVTGD